MPGDSERPSQGGNRKTEGESNQQQHREAAALGGTFHKTMLVGLAEFDLELLDRVLRFLQAQPGFFPVKFDGFNFPARKDRLLDVLELLDGWRDHGGMGVGSPERARL